MRSSLDEVYRCETGFIARDRNLNNPQFGIDGYVGGLVLRRVIVDNYAPPVSGFLIQVMAASERMVRRVFEEGERIVVSDGRVLKSGALTPKLDLKLKEKGFATDSIRDLDWRYGTELKERLKCDERRYVTVVAPDLIRRMNVWVNSGPAPVVKLEVNTSRLDIAHLNRAINGLAKRVKERFDKLPESARRPYKTDQVVLQQLYDSVVYRRNEQVEEDDYPMLQPSGFWPLSRFVEAFLLQVSWRGLDRS